MSARARVISSAPPTNAAQHHYQQLDAAERYIHITRDRAWLALLEAHGRRDLKSQRILELGCAEGALLRSLLHYGAEAGRLDGIDKDAAAVDRAQAALPELQLSVADGAALPQGDATFDLVFAFTFFTSVLDPETRRRCAAEALRILRPGGMLVVYDFWVNPFNPRVRSLRTSELRSLFAPRPIEFERLTLAPPIVRALGGRTSLCSTLDRLPFLRTHLLAAIMKES